MSLVASIFGDLPSSNKKQKSNAGLKSLFEKKIEVEESEKVEKEESTSSNSDSDSSDDSSNSGDSSKSDEKEDDQDEIVDAITKEKPEEDGSAIEKDSKTKKRKAKDSKTSKEETKEDEAAEEEPTEDEAERTVFVGNLPLSATRKSLIKLFSQVGKVKSARLRSTAVTGCKVQQQYAGNQNLVKKVCTNTQQWNLDAKASLQGYVVFAEKETVPLAIEKLNNHPLEDRDPKATRAVRRIRVDTASPTLDPKRSVFVGNLPYQADEASLQDHFVQGCGLEIHQVKGVRIIRDKETFQCKGFGYVLFEDATLVATALQKMHESIYMKRPLRVKVCGKSLKGRRGQEQPKKKKQRTNTNDEVVAPTGAFRRVISASKTAGNAPTGAKKNKRLRGEKKKSKPGIKPGVSKRAASEAKAEKRAKKIEKRMSKGMGKNRKSS